MIHRQSMLALAALALLTIVSAQSTCNATVSCPASAPCCSEYGFCGTGSYCLGGCEPLYSYKPDSCLPNPVCENLSSTFYNLERVQVNASLYNGNASAYDWVVNSGSVIATDEGTRLLLTQNNSGTKISSTRYVHYGRIEFVLKTSKWPGVVTASITMSDVKDEIDLEFTGHSVNEAQTNYWYLGVANCERKGPNAHVVRCNDLPNAESATQGQSVHVDQDTFQNFHTYAIDWKEDSISWLVDGNIVRTVLKADTYTSDGIPHYPMTPSRIQLSIWPAGIPSSAPGTIDWSGGMIDWSDPDYVANGYFWNVLQSVNVICADDPTQAQGTTGWVYSGNGSDGVPHVLDTNASTIIGGASRGVDLPHGTMTQYGAFLAPLVIACLAILAQ